MSETSLTVEKIQIWKCKDCGKIEPTRSFVCTDCHSRNSEIGFIDSTGIVVASTIIRRPAAGTNFEGPICLCVVKLEADVLVSGHFCRPETVSSGSRVFAFEYNNDVPIFSLWDEN